VTLRGDTPMSPALRALARLPNVIGVSLGLKEAGGVFTRELAVVVEVRRKLPEADLPRRARVPRHVGNLPTDVQEAVNAAFCRPGDGVLPADRTRVRPLRSGASIGTSGDHAGTLGFFARRNADSKPVLVGNYHVLYRGRALLDITGEPHHVFQPPRGSDNRVGAVTTGSIGGSVDCACAVLDEEGSSCCCRSAIAHENRTVGTLSGGADDGVQMTGIRRARVDNLVTKTGRSTGRTFGRVVHVSKSVDGAVDYSAYDLPAGSSFNFSDLIMIVRWDPVADDFDVLSPFAEGGDSGSAIVNEAGEIVGLHFMSFHDPATGRHFGFACHIEAVESALEITVPGTRAGLGTPAGTPIAALDQPIDPSAGTVMIGGATFPRRRVDLVAEALLARLAATDAGRAWLGLFERHQHEVLGLVNRRRGVTLAWQRSAGPAWLAAAVRSLTVPGYLLPERIDGTTSAELAEAMGAALARDGSPALRADLKRHGDRLLARLREVTTVDDGIAALAAEAPDEALAADA
jgi:hypothetical protein